MLSRGPCFIRTWYQPQRREFCARLCASHSKLGMYKCFVTYAERALPFQPCSSHIPLDAAAELRKCAQSILMVRRCTAHFALTLPTEEIAASGRLRLCGGNYPSLGLRPRTIRGFVPSLPSPCALVQKFRRCASASHGASPLHAMMRGDRGQ